MKFLFDQNISHRILSYLPTIFPQSTTIKQQQLINASDKEIWEYAKLNDYTIVTQDSDFNYINSLYGFPPKIIWLRSGNMSTLAIAHILSEHLEEIKKFAQDNQYGCFEIFGLSKK